MLLFVGVTRPPTDEGFKMIDEDMTCSIPDPIYSQLIPERRVELAEKIRNLYFKGSHVNKETTGPLVDVSHRCKSFVLIVVENGFKICH